MAELTDLGISAMGAGLRAGEFSARELTEAHLQALDAAKPLNAWITPTPELALAAADAADAALKAGAAGALAGIPVGVKDNFCMKGVRTTAASRMLENFTPGYDSMVTHKLDAAGAVTLGKLNLDEFAMGNANENSAFGPVISPWRATDSNADLAPGGSSGGSAAAVAARLCAAALGSDTGGSVRQPAALCGVVGLKPTYGRCSRFGIIAFASSLDQAGILARSVADCASVLEVIAGHDPRDQTSLTTPVPAYSQHLQNSLQGVRIGIPAEYRVDGMDPAIDPLWQQAAEWARDAGAEIVHVSLPHSQVALPTYYALATAEASSNLARYDGVRYGLRAAADGGSLADMYMATRAAGFGAEVKRRILVGTHMLSSDYYEKYFIRAQKVRSLVARDFATAWEVCDLLLAPTAPTAAFPLGHKGSDLVATYQKDVFTVPASLAGLPALSLPLGVNAQGLPLGLQLIGRALDEQTVLNAAFVLEQACGFAARPPRWWAA